MRYLVWCHGPVSDAGVEFTTEIRQHMFNSAVAIHDALESVFGDLVVFVIDSKTGQWGKYVSAGWSGDLRP